MSAPAPSVLSRPRLAASAFPPPRPAPVEAAFPLGEAPSVLQSVTFYMGLALVFIKFAMLQEIQTAVMGFNAYLLYPVGIPAILGIVMGGGIQRTMSARTTFYWLAFSVWAFVCVPFSSWMGGSLRVARNFVEYDLLMLFVIAGLVVTWRQCELLIKAMCVAALLNVITSRLFSAQQGGREGLEFGTVSNANDWAAHLLLTLPFLLLWFSRSKSIVLRVIATLALGYGTLVIFKTGSRGAMIALAVDIVFVILLGSGRQRIAVICVIPVTLAAVMVLVPSTIMRRLHSFSTTDTDASAEAIASSEARRYLLGKAIQYGFEFPLTGVGPGQFVNYEGSHNTVWGSHGMYHGAHNSWVAAFAEGGVPLFLTLVAANVSAFLLLLRAFRKARARPDCRDIQTILFYTLLGMLGFNVAITFVNFTFSFYGPALAGIAISLYRASGVEMERRSLAAPAPAPGMPVFGRPLARVEVKPA